MFKGRHFEVKLKKDQPIQEWEKEIDGVPAATFNMNPTQVSDAASDFVTKTAGTIVIAYSATKMVGTLCKIIEIAAKAKFK